MAKRKKKQHLLPRQHTAKLLHKQHTSYPVLALLLLMIGILLAFSTVQAWAAEISVTAKANGPVPSLPATIISPTNGDNFSGLPVPVSGTCEPTYIVKIFRNGLYSGAERCDPDGTFLINIDLFPGQNELEAKIYNAADQAGPASDSILVYYTPPTPPPSPTPTPTPSTPTTPTKRPPSSSTIPEPFVITTEKHYQAAFSSQRIIWEFTIIGGQAPYQASVAWGDGESEVIAPINDKTFKAVHTYQAGSREREYYTVVITIYDANGRRASLHSFSIINTDHDAKQPIAAGPSILNGRGDSLLRAVLYAWPWYLITVLMAISFWLGEKRGYSLRNSQLSNRRRSRKA